MSKYVVTLNGKQLNVVKEALELRFRIDLLQSNELVEILATINTDETDFDPHKPDHKEIFNSYLERRRSIGAIIEAIFEIACPRYSRLLQKKRNKDSLIAEDIWQVIRHQQWIDLPKDSRSIWTTDSRSPLPVSEEDLPTIERVEI